MTEVEHFIRLHGQTRLRTFSLALLALVFVLVLRFAIASSVAPEPMGPIESWVSLAFVALTAVALVRAIWHAFAPRIEVTLAPYPLVAGEPVRVAWQCDSHRGACARPPDRGALARSALRPSGDQM